MTNNHFCGLLQCGEREIMMITSKDHAIIKEVSALMAGAKHRRELQCFVAEGVRLCCDGVQSGAPVRAFLYTQEAAEKYPFEFQQLSSAAEKSYEISQKLFERIGDTKSPQGFLCMFRMPPVSAAAGSLRKTGRYAALENLQDPSNLGTILRTAEALGMDGVILSADCCDVYAPKVVRGSMGAVFRLPIMIVREFTEFIGLLTKQGFHTFGSTPHDAEELEQIDFSTGGVMLVGNEGNGLREATLQACSHRVRIAMRGRAESLNAAAAAAILLYKLQG